VRRRALACVLVIASCDSAPAARVCTITAPQADFRLVTDGTQLEDSLGRVVYLRGVNAGTRSKFAPYVPFDFGNDYEGALAAYMDRAASWGIDVMRVPFVWAALEPALGQDDAVWLSRFDEFIDAAWARGIWSVLDFHQDVYAENFCGDGFPAWTLVNPPAPHHDCAVWSTAYTTDPVKAAFDAFWAQGSSVQAAYFSAWDRMIARYKDRPGVLGFEPINECSGGSQLDDDFSATTLSDFYAKWVAHARSLAPTSLVFVEPSGTSGVTLATTLVRPPGDGVVFAPHLYPLVTSVDAVMSNVQKLQAIGAAWNTPTWVGEFGASNLLDSTLPRMQATFAAFDALGLSGTEWEYSTATELWDDEQYSLTDASGNELPVAQAIIRPYARAVAGSNVAMSFDPATSTYTLGYAPRPGGVTVVSLPAKAFPSGYEVALEGACYDVTSAPGQMLIQPDAASSSVSLTIRPK
jgi:endoglycosylceramidase